MRIFYTSFFLVSGFGCGLVIIWIMFYLLNRVLEWWDSIVDNYFWFIKNKRMRCPNCGQEIKWEKD